MSDPLLAADIRYLAATVRLYKDCINQERLRNRPNSHAVRILQNRVECYERLLKLCTEKSSTAPNS